MSLEYVEFGSLYLDDILAVPGINVLPDQSIRLGNTCSTCKIPWVFDGKKYIAIKNVCNNVSWKDLVNVKRGYAVSPIPNSLRVIQIDGKAYHSRLIGEDGSIEEWKALLAEWEQTKVPTPYAEDPWHCNGTQFWTNINCGPQTQRLIIGGETEYDSASWPQETCCPSIGYRPVLEPLPLLDFNTAKKKECIRIYGPKDIIEGWLQNVNDYDVIIKPRPGKGPSFNCTWAKEIDKDKAVIDRSAIIWARRIDARRRP